MCINNNSGFDPRTLNDLSLKSLGEYTNLICYIREQFEKGNTKLLITNSNMSGRHYYNIAPVNDDGTYKSEQSFTGEYFG